MIYEHSTSLRQSPIKGNNIQYTYNRILYSILYYIILYYINIISGALALDIKTKLISLNKAFLSGKR